MISETHHIDCMQYMKTLPDNFFELAIVGPPYGIDAGKDAGNRANKRYGQAAAKSGNYEVKLWDKEIPPPYIFQS